MEGDGDATLRFDWKLFETSEMCEWNDFGRFEDITNAKTAEQQTIFKRSQMDNMP